MARYVTPFLVFNLGAEMVFVVAQRLGAQNVPHDKSTFVLDEVISVLVSNQLITEIMKPQSAYSRSATKNLIEDIAQSSAMRLDTHSMDKLWDLISMVFKWQLTLSTDLISLTLRHLYEIENYVTNPDTHLQLHKVQNLVDNFNKVLTPIEKIELRDHALYWLRDFNVRVSLLLRMGLQDLNGNFLTEDLEPFPREMLRNLGENIYSVTRNGEIMSSEDDNKLNKADDGEDNNTHAETLNQNLGGNGVELQMLADQLRGGRSSNDGSPHNVLRLSISSCQDGLKSSYMDNQMFENIDLQEAEGESKEIQDLFDGMSINDEGSEENFQDELLNIIEASSSEI